MWKSTFAACFDDINAHLRANAQDPVVTVVLGEWEGHPQREVNVRLRWRLGGDQSFVHCVMGLLHCNAGHSCPLCVVHTDHR